MKSFFKRHMGGRMTLWQLITGCVICTVITLSVFLPRITVSADRLTDVALDMVQEAIKDYKGDSENIFANAIDEDDVEDLREDIEESLPNGSVSKSSAWLIFAGKQSVREFFQELDDRQDYSEEKYDDAFDKVQGALLFPRILLLLVYIFPLVLIVIYIFTYRSRGKNTLAIAVTWIYFVLAAFSNIVWFFLLPSAGSKKMVDYAQKSMGSAGIGMSMFKGSVADMLSAFIRRLLNACTGMGLWLFIAVTLLLFAYSMLLFFNGAVGGLFQNTAQDIGNPAVNSLPSDDFFLDGVPGDDLFIEKSGRANWEPERSVPVVEDHLLSESADMMTCSGEKTDIIGGSSTVPHAGSARIRMVKGSLRGAEISCRSGEKIVVGRDPAEASLILSHPKVSRKHFSIQYVGASDRYEIYCFSKNGVCLSTGGKIGMSQSASIARGTKIVLADGAEEIVLD